MAKTLRLGTDVVYTFQETGATS